MTVGGAPVGFVFPAAQLTLGTSTFTTTTTGFLHARLATSGGLSCATASTYFGWLEVDGVPMPSSRVGIGENFGAGGDFTAANFAQKILEGVTSEPVAGRLPRAAGTIRVCERCRSKLLGRWQRCRRRDGARAAPTLPTTAMATFGRFDFDASTMCIVDAAGSEVCAER